MIKIESNEMKIVSTLGGFVAAGLGAYQVVVSVYQTIGCIIEGYGSLITGYLGQAFFWMTVVALGLFLIRLGNEGKFDGIVSSIHSSILIACQDHRAKVAQKVAKVKLAHDEKQCPHCGGVIKARARKCKHCHTAVK
jgi:hypothetical protein